MAKRNARSVRVNTDVVDADLIHAGGEGDRPFLHAQWEIWVSSGKERSRPSAPDYETFRKWYGANPRRAEWKWLEALTAYARAKGVFEREPEHYALADDALVRVRRDWEFLSKRYTYYRPPTELAAIRETFSMRVADLIAATKDPALTSDDWETIGLVAGYRVCPMHYLDLDEQEAHATHRLLTEIGWTAVGKLKAAGRSPSAVSGQLNHCYHPAGMSLHHSPYEPLDEGHYTAIVEATDDSFKDHERAVRDLKGNPEYHRRRMTSQIYYKAWLAVWAGRPEAEGMVRDFVSDALKRGSAVDVGWALRLRGYLLSHPATVGRKPKQAAGDFADSAELLAPEYGNHHHTVLGGLLKSAELGGWPDSMKDERVADGCRIGVFREAMGIRLKQIALQIHGGVRVK